MTTLNLNEEQRDTLKETLTSYLSDLRMEIADTDSYDFREGLKHKQAVLEQIQTMLTRD